MEKAMAMPIFVVLVSIVGGAGLSEAAVYSVGDAVGWTILGSPNYTAWAISKRFNTGDTIEIASSARFSFLKLRFFHSVYGKCLRASKQELSFRHNNVAVFKYNKNFHNVLEVSKADYKACSAASPIAAYTSGNDSITLKRRGHHFFICGVPGHCSAGQKVDVRIAKLTASSAAPSVAPAASPLPATSSGSGSNSSGGGVVSNPAAAPRPSGANTATPTALALALALLYPVFSGGLVAVIS
ncbi:Plastocyanin-like domain [Musa troglodytarum]|uniref:Plastocyanin-like domain n=1 Tax=Musa troglodytarum TaxID=320322 RepID=A0A9E7L8I1_9LILI|nr:Plastocyanin-like domain [Musa troglodytarum]